MRFYLLPGCAFLLLGAACAPIDQRQGGGGAFSDSEVARTLDANGALPSEGVERSRSFTEWRESR